LSLGLSDDAIDEVSLYAPDGNKWHKLLPSDTGRMELPIWVAHVGAKDTKWQRYDLQPSARIVDEPPSKNEWIKITVPLRSTA
jgi:CRISPR-associated protein Cas5t